MPAIPLHCNICPREPEFSDISHLLTHVASKGHLSHYFKAQVRARQDENIRQKLDTYDRWYDRHQIEKLLSQRMSSKELKDGSKSKTATSNSGSTRRARSTKPRSREIKKPSMRDQSPSPVKTEEIIDPQLTQSLLLPRTKPPLLESPSQAAALKHRAHIPRMLDWQAESPILHRRSSSLPPYCKPSPRVQNGSGGIDGGESDYFHTFLRSPTRTIYPDPPAFLDFENQALPTKVDSSDEKNIACPSPVLKGVKWPGMSLFDSASQRAQRLRNQKKDGSVLEQMEIDSAAVEPMEHIYWPEGDLKKKRLITGNVESSPVKETTPPSKHQREKASRVLETISTNVPRIGKKRGRRPGKVNQPKVAGLQNMAGRALNTLESVFPKDVNLGYTTSTDSEDEPFPTKGSPTSRRKPDFTVFNDSGRDGPHDSANSIISETRIARDATLQYRAPRHGLPASTSYSTKMSDSILSSGQFPSRFSTTMSRLATPILKDSQRYHTSEDRENFLPIPESSNDVEDDEMREPQRSTQRYFSVTGDQPPQFFDTMPPQMDFGGMAGPVFYGASLNPLNASLRQQYQQPQYSPTLLTQSHLTTALGQSLPGSTSDETVVGCANTKTQRVPR